MEILFALELAIIARLSPIVVTKTARIVNSSVDKESLKKIDIILAKPTNSLPDNFVKKSKTKLTPYKSAYNKICVQKNIVTKNFQIKHKVKQKAYF